MLINLDRVEVEAFVNSFKAEAKERQEILEAKDSGGSQPSHSRLHWMASSERGQMVYEIGRIHGLLAAFESILESERRHPSSAEWDQRHSQAQPKKIGP